MSDVNSSLPEGFRVIPGFPRYAIDEHGTLLSICITGRGAHRTLHWNDARRISPQLDSHGYLFVVLHGTPKRRAFIHTLVLETFTSPCPSGMECRHLDGDKTNNHVSNLAWGTRAENSHDKISHGTSNHGQRNHRSKLIDDDIRQIRKRAANGEPHQSIADDFPVARTAITRIINNQRWKHV